MNPPAGTSGTIAITFSGTVANGIVAGARNFANVDQTTPLGTPGSANGSSTASSVTLTGLNGNELIFDNLFQGASSSSQTLTVGQAQTQQWNQFVSNTAASASIEEATGNSVTMSWTAASSSYWAIVAVPLNPASTTPPVQFTINATAGSNGAITPSGAVVVNQAGNQTFSITPSGGYAVDDVLVDGSSIGAVTSYTFSNVQSDHTITASFEPLQTFTIMASAGANGSISPSGSVSVQQGAIQIFNMTPASGYRVSDVLVDGSSVGAVPSYQFNNVQGNHSIAVSFEVLPPNSIIYLGQVGSVTNNSAGTSLALPLTSPVSAGTTLIVGFASRGASTYNQPTSPMQPAISIALHLLE